MGFYPVTPGSNQYIIGTPLFEKTTINLENGIQFTIAANHLRDSNIYIESASLNGKPLTHTFLSHEDIVNGGILEFNMTNHPAVWGTKTGEEPKTEILEHLIVPVPFIAEGDIAFKGKTEVTLGNVDKDALIFYSINDSEFIEYKHVFHISESTRLKAYSEKNGTKSATIETQFYKIDPNLSIELKTEYANQYNAGGNDALIDGVFGTQDFRTGTWQGYWNDDLIATINLGKITSFEEVSVNFLEDQRSWIFLPNSVECLYSVNGKDFKRIDEIKINNVNPSEHPTIKTISFKIPSYHKIQYLKIIAKKLGKLPEWHLGYAHDGRSWIFVDEITVK
jgi:hypothetical protein